MILATGAIVAIVALGRQAIAGQGGQLRLEVVDRDTQEPVACRMHLTNAAKRPLKAPKVPFWHDHFVFSGSIVLKLPKGEYAFEIERGPEYLTRMGHFTMDNFSDDRKTVDLKRFVDMSAEGWWSGDLDVARPEKDLELLMLADDLHVAELVSWPNGKHLLSAKRPTDDPLVRFDGNCYYHVGAGSDARAGGTLLLFNLETPLDLAGAKPEFPPSSDTIVAAKRQAGASVDAPKAFAWDLPLWIATGGLDSIELANSGLGRKSTIAGEAGGKPRDTRLFPGNAGTARWSETIYYRLLDCGLQIPPTAGSGSGTVANPLGYNRVYVQVDGEFDYAKWWEGLRGGRVMVTNGPLIRPTVEGEMPGHVFRAARGQEVELEVGVTLSTRDPVSYFEIIKDGQLAHQVRLDDWAKNGGKLPPVRFKESGWFLMRAVTNVAETYRFAMTGPYYVEVGDQPRISKSAAQFFLDWVDERAQSVKLDNAKEREAAENYIRAARDYWQEKVKQANVE